MLDISKIPSKELVNKLQAALEPRSEEGEIANIRKAAKERLNQWLSSCEGLDKYLETQLNRSPMVGGPNSSAAAAFVFTDEVGRRESFIAACGKFLVKEVGEIAKRDESLTDMAKELGDALAPSIKNGFTRWAR